MPDDRPTIEAPEVSSPDITLVGIGASAGGLTALKALFSEMPTDTGFAFVVVMHLSPDRESSLPELLQRCTSMRVTQVASIVKVEPNHIYVIPPNRNLSTIDSHLRLSELEEKRRERAPIDHFLATLASTHGERSIGVILSGTGGDGAMGLSNIKERAGITLAQDPQEAEFDGMPRTAIATGLVDFVLPVDGIRDRIVKLSRIQPRITLRERQDALDPNEQRLLEKVLAQVQIHSGQDFSRYKVTTVMRRVRRRMQINCVERLSDYLQLLRENENEARDLFDDLLITVTNFFRDREVFEAIERLVVPKLFEGKGPEDSVRAWVNGCSSGEEAYTITMLLMERAAQMTNPPVVQVFASDLHEKSLVRAREGRYPETIAADVSAERLDRYFDVEKGGGYRIKKSVRERVIFAPHNLIADPPFSRLDLVTCRNVMIYFKRDVQQDLIDLFLYALNPGGYLALGTSEAISHSGGAFHPVEKGFSIYRKTGVRSPKRLPAVALGARRRFLDAAEISKARIVGAASFGALHQQIVEQYGPPSVLLNGDHDIVHYSQSAGRYLCQPGGEPTNNVFKRVLEPLRIELRAAVLASQRDGEETRTKPIGVAIDRELKSVVLRVQSPRDGGLEGFHLVIFDEQEPAPGESGGADRGKRANFEELETELELARRRMQALIEEYETGQEEMRAANEELQSANEELRSTMEELETSKEELQSMNEELTTVNQENRFKVEELSEMTSDLQNLLAATDIATLFLDRDCSILRFTPKVGELINVRQSDRGRPLGDFTHRLGYFDLASDAKQVLSALLPIHREARAEDGRWYLLRLLPYRSLEDKVNGVVITLVEITELKRSNEELESLTRTLEERVRRSTEQFRRLASKLALAEERERSRIAQILHDDLQQTILSAQMRLQAICEDHGVKPESSKEAFQELKRAIDLARDLSIDLSPPALNNEGLKESLQWLANQTRRLHGLAVDLRMADDFSVPDKDIRMMLFQIGRELLFNVAKHAGVDRATLELSYQDGSARMVVSDAGRGFDVNKLEERRSDSSGFGLGSIRERLDLIGGACEIASSPGGGTQVAVTIPSQNP